MVVTSTPLFFHVLICIAFNLCLVFPCSNQISQFIDKKKVQARHTSRRGNEKQH